MRRAAASAVRAAAFAALLAAGVIAAPRLAALHGETAAALGQFRAAGGNYDQLRAAHPDTRLGKIARMFIPPDGPYDYSDASAGLHIRVRYELYPNLRRDREHWLYFIDSERNPVERKPDWRELAIPGAGRIYARNGAEFVAASPPPPEYPIGAQIRTFLGVLLVQAVCGALVLRGLGISPAFAGAAYFAGAAWLCGLVLLNGALWLGLVLGMPFTRGAVIGVWGALIAAAAGFAWLRRGKTLPPVADAPTQTDAHRMAGIFAAGVCVWLAAVWIVPPLLSPVNSWDAISHWIYKSKALLHHGSLAFSSETHHNDYPLLWPIHNAALFALAGGALDELAQWSVAALCLALLSQLHGTLRVLGLPRVWACALIAVFLAGFTEVSLRWAYAETLLLALMTGAMAAMAHGLRHGFTPGGAALTGILLTGCAAAKLEGGPACVILAIAACAAHRSFPRVWRAWPLLLFASPILLGAAWGLYQEAHGFAVGSHLREPVSAERVRLLAQRLFNDARGGLPAWGPAALMLAAALLVFPRRWTPPRRFLALAGLGLLLFIPAALLGWRTRHIDAATMTATPRLLLHAAPPLFLLLGSLVYDPGGIRRDTTESRDG